MTNQEKEQQGTEKEQTTIAKALNSTEQSNISDHAQFENMVFQGLKSGGVHLTGSKNSGKTRLLWAISETLMKQENMRVIAFDGSESWIYGFSQIPVFTIGEHDIFI